MQNSHPVAYTSRSLTECESRCAQIMKGLFTMVFAVTKVHHFIYGTQVELESDHKPLEAILKKHKAMSRIQLMLLTSMLCKLEIKHDYMIFI